jgi:hypothetical protein
LIRFLQTILVAHALLVLFQASVAGEFLSGTDSVVKFHEFAGWTTLAVGLVQTLVAGLALRGGSLSLGIFIGSILVMLAEALQVGTGYGRFLRVHIPLGVIVFGAVIVQMISVFRRPVKAR